MDNTLDVALWTYCMHNLRKLRAMLHVPSHLARAFAFRSSEVRRLLLDLDPYGGTDPLGMFPLFLRELLMLWPPVFV